MSTKNHLYELHADNKEWLNRLAFYADELTFLEHRLQEVASKYTDRDILALCDSYGNRLTIQRNEIYRLKETIKSKEELLEKAVFDNPVAVDHREFPDEEKERDAVANFELIYYNLRKELIAFFSKWM